LFPSLLLEQNILPYTSARNWRLKENKKIRRERKYEILFS